MIGDVSKKLALGEKVSLRATVDGLRDLIQDLRRGGDVPEAIVLSYKDRRDLNDDMMGHSVTPVDKADANDNEMQITIIEGVMVGWNRTVQNGRCIIVMKPRGERSATPVTTH